MSSPFKVTEKKGLGKLMEDLGPAGVAGLAVGGIKAIGAGIAAGTEAKRDGAGGGEQFLEGALGLFGMQDMYTSKRAKAKQAKQAEQAAGMSAAETKLLENQMSMSTTPNQDFVNKYGNYSALPMKSLKSIPYNPPKNMSASQYDSGLKMEKISGISERRTNEKKY